MITDETVLLKGWGFPFNTYDGKIAKEDENHSFPGANLVECGK